MNTLMLGTIITAIFGLVLGFSLGKNQIAKKLDEIIYKLTKQQNLTEEEKSYVDELVDYFDKEKENDAQHN